MIEEDPTSQTAFRRDGPSARRRHGPLLRPASTALVLLALFGASVWAGRTIGLALTAPARASSTSNSAIAPSVVVDTPSRWRLEDHAPQGRLLVDVTAGSKSAPYVLQIGAPTGRVETIHGRLPDALFVPLRAGRTYWVSMTSSLPVGFEQMRSEVVTIVPGGTTSLQVVWPTRPIRRPSGASS